MTSYGYTYVKAKGLADALKKLDEDVEGITFKDQRINAADTVKFANALQGHRKCKGLDYCDNNAGPAGMKAFCRAFTTRHNLITTLCIHTNNIGPEGGMHLATALSSPHCRLSELFLGSNNIQDKGAVPIANALRHNQYVVAVYLGRNKLTDVTGRAFLEIMQTNYTLRTLQLHEEHRIGEGLNVIDKKIVEEVNARLAANSELQKESLTMLMEDASGPWMRSKLMVIGQGRAGKTATIRTLLSQPFDPALESTVGASLSQTKVKAGDGGWSDLDSDAQDFLGAFTRRLVTNDFLEKVAVAEKEGKVLTPSKSTVEPPLNDDTSSTELVQTPVDDKTWEEDGLDSQNAETELLALAFGGQTFIYDKNDHYNLSFSVWDYGGQKVFYTLHHLFLTEQGVYLLVVDMTELINQEETAVEYILFWLNSVKIHAPKAPLLIIGTHWDKTADKQTDLNRVDKALGKVLGQKFPQVVLNDTMTSSTGGGSFSFFPLDNKAGEGINIVRAKVQEVALAQDYVKSPVKLKWVAFIDLLLREKADASWISLETATEMAKSCEVHDSAEIQTMLRFFHEMGSIVYFTATETLKDVITVSPQWLVDSISRVIHDQKLHELDMAKLTELQLDTDVNTLYQEGLASRDLLEYVWEDNKQVGFLLELMKETLLLSPWNFSDKTAGDQFYLIPSMVMAVNPAIDQTFGELVEQEEMKLRGTITLDFTKSFLPQGVFERMVCVGVALNHEGTRAPLLAKESALVFLSQTTSLHMSIVPNKVEVKVLGSDKLSASLRLVMSIIRKVGYDVMNGRLKWQTMLTTDGNTVKYEDAQKKKAAPWFERDSGAIGYSAAKAFNLDAFA